MNAWNQLTDVYFDTMTLRNELERIPQECNCADADAHLSGICCCSSAKEQESAPVKQSCMGCHATMQQLRHSISRFKSDLTHERMNQGWNSLYDYERRWQFLIENAVSSIDNSLNLIERDLNEFRATCAHKALQRLKKRGEDLDKYINNLNAGMVEYERHDNKTNNNKPFAQRESNGDLSGESQSVKQKIAEREPPTPITPEYVKSLIEKHRVCYEVWREYAMVGEKRIQIGYDLQLCGVNKHDGDNHGGQPPVPGCAHCRRTFNDLRLIAEWIVPKDERKTIFKIQPFDRSLHVAPRQRRSRNEVVLTIELLHRHDINSPADDCEDKCLKEMKTKLAELEVLEGRWRGEFT